jgi:hypothetical protein
MMLLLRRKCHDSRDEVVLALVSRVAEWTDQSAMGNIGTPPDFALTQT